MKRYSEEFKKDAVRLALESGKSQAKVASDLEVDVNSLSSWIKTELICNKRYRTREEARRDIFEYIEMFYNRQRLHSSLGYKSPAEFESEYRLAAQAA